MKKIYAIIVVLSLFALSVSAQRVAVDEATNVCINFLKEKGQVADAEAVRLAETYTQPDGTSALYRFTTSGGGFVVVSASTTTPPVLAYSLDNDFEMIPPVRDLFHLYKQEIAVAEKNNWDARSEAASRWKELLSNDLPHQPKRGTAGGPLLTTTWDQGKFYNTYCPWDVLSGPYYDYRVPNGCVALACSQILNYHRYPESGNGMTTYIPQGYPRQTVYYYNHKYNYDAMCNKPTNYANEIAKLAYHYGVAIQMNYNYDGSGANTARAKEKFVSIFKYDPSITTYYRGSYFDTLVSEFIEILKEEIDLKRPVYYSGCTETYASCHAYVLDGYDEDNLFHINYGWGGASNAYYAIDNFVAGPSHFDFGAETIAKIFPSNAATQNYCGGHKRNTASFGYVSDESPTTKPYQQNPDCSWMVAVQDAFGYEFKFDRLDLADGDYVTIYNGPTEESGVKVSLTGSETPNTTYNVAADSVLITFRGNANNTNHYGFLISYSSDLPARTCNSNNTLANVWTATISDGSQEGDNYMPSTNCSWNITHNYISGYAFTFTKFNLGYGDFVDIYDISDYTPVLHKRFDIYNLPEGIYNVPFKRMRVNFVSDNWDQNEGFEMGFYALAAIEDYNGMENINVYPNPAADNVNIEFNMPESGNITFSIRDITGKLLNTSSESVEQGANHITLDIAGYPKGLYLLEMETVAGKSVRKIIVQ